MARELLDTINGDRAARHLHPLFLDRVQSRCSLHHSRHMAAKNRVSHDQFPGDVCVPFLSAGENVGAAVGDADQALLLLNRQMMAEGPCRHRRCSLFESATHGHYLNLMSAVYRRIGIGIYQHAGMTWLTEDFVG